MCVCVVDKYLEIRNTGDFKQLMQEYHKSCLNFRAKIFRVQLSKMLLNQERKCFEINHVHVTTATEELVSLFGLLDPEDKGNTVRRNVKTYLPDDKLQYPRRLSPQLRVR